MQFEERRPFAGDLGALWSRVSKIEDIPRYWHGTRELSEISHDGGVAAAKVRFAFGGTGRAQFEVLHEEKKVVVRYLSGPFIGTQTIWVDGSGIGVKWNVTFRGALRIVSRWNGGHFKEGSRHALERLCEGIEIGQAVRDVAESNQKPFA